MGLTILSGTVEPGLAGSIAQDFLNSRDYNIIRHSSKTFLFPLSLVVLTRREKNGFVQEPLQRKLLQSAWP